MAKPNKYPATLEMLVKYQLPDKTISYRKAFYRWFVRKGLRERLEREPDETEINNDIVKQKEIKHDMLHAGYLRGLMQDCLETFEREHNPPPPKPPDFTKGMSLKRFLRAAFWDLRLFDERLHLYRKYTSHNFKIETHFTGNRLPHESLDDAAARKTDDFITKQSRDGIPDSEWYYLNLDAIGKWRVANRTFQRKRANESRWLKERRKKILRLLQNRITDMSQH